MLGNISAATSANAGNVLVAANKPATTAVLNNFLI